ncbi:MAG TPA: biosynthetic peptidoglycan transglycosylase [Polyangiaceae bacterium]|nr:biosynthetic peptidoglycan transglycosylase [Polyangiaceae bacterium]
MVGAAGVVLLAPAAAVGPVVRAVVSSRAAARGVSVEIERVRPTLGGVWLLGVTFRGRDARVRGEVDAVRVPFGNGPIEVHGGRLVLRGRLQELQRDVSSDRTGSTSGRGGRLLRADGLGLRWTEFDRRGSTLEAWGVAAERRADADGARVDLLRARSRGGAVDAHDIELALARTGDARLKRLELSRVVASLDLDAFGRDGDVGGAPARPPASPASTRTPSPGGRAGAVLGLEAFAEVAKQALPTGAEVRTQSALVALGFHGEHLGFGPSEVSLRREPDALALEVAPSERSSRGATPLALRGRLPFGADPPSVELEGGPVSLAALGVRDGELGLTHTRDATLEAHLHVELAAGSVRGSGSGSLMNLSLQRRELGAQEVRGLNLGFRTSGEAALDGSRVSLRDTEVTVGEVKAAGSFEYARDESGVRLRVAGGVPLASCDAVVASIPAALLNDAAGVRLEGTFALDHALTYDSAHPSALALTLHVENGCRVVSAPPELSPDRFRAAWTREVKGPDGLPMTIRSGPGTPEWVAYDDIPHAMEVAVLVCEDGGFYRHHGFDFRAMEKAMRDDILAGRFLRGASTISMQLAKNLYLGKEKTLSRKLEEALLTMLLEAKLSKRELIELYLNVVELGPGIYGIGEAARYYFDEDARQLSLGQALYLASILPDPTRQHFAPDGRLMPHWWDYLKKLMHIARDHDRITDDDLDAGLAEEIAFRKGNGESESRDLDATEPASITKRHKLPLDDDDAEP